MTLRGVKMMGKGILNVRFVSQYGRYVLGHLLTSIGLSKAPTPASFIRPTRKPDPEQSFVEAVFHKYASGDAITPEKQIVISGKVAEEVGFDKIAEQQARVHELKIVLVDGQRINRAHSKLRTTQASDTSAVDFTVAEACPSIVELDLSRNLFGTLDEVEKICEQLKNLKTLRLK